MTQISEILESEQEKMTIGKILAGCTAGKLQSVGLMQVIPLLSDIVDDRFASPKNVRVSTTTYGTIVFDNKSEEKPVIVPTGAQYLTKERAQDHALGTAGFVKGKSGRTFNNARCVQQTQGGYITPGQHKLGILPYALREYALKIKSKVGYGDLWPSISRFNSEHGLSQGTGHLVYFFDHFKKQLDEFVAEFEIVPKQVGAIILVDGDIIGIERAPSYQYWQEVWEALIRDCYGSQAISATRSGNVLARSLELRPKMDINSLNEGDPISRVREVLQATQNSEEELVKTKIRQLIGNAFDVKKDETLQSAELMTVSHDQLTGQVIKDGETVIYASMTTVKDFKWERRASSKYMTAPEEFSI